MTQRHELRWGGFAGLAFLFFAFLGALLPGTPPRVTATDTEIIAYIKDHETGLLLAALMFAASAGLVIWFSAALAEALRERDERSDVHMALLAGSVLVAGSMFMGAAGSAAMTYGIDNRSPELTVMMFEGLMVLYALSGLTAVLPIAAAGVGVLRTKMLPNWLGYLGLVSAAVSALGALAVFAQTGDYVPGGPFMSWISLLAGGVFVLCASIFMVREHLPEMTPMGSPI
ncbi:MAG TPA: DUF4386 family protein [Nocardioidaceae bacterium]|nr:DUF4386 family protein [Nocardioidaceae bacterium]